jgi:hypothetical protein
VQAVTRLLLAILAGLMVALPAVGDETGGGGDSGIWILPRASGVGGPTSCGGGAGTSLAGPRAALVLPLLRNPVTMQMPTNMGQPMAALYETPGCARLPLVVSGNRVTLPVSTLKYVRDSVSGLADGWMIDANGCGFLLRVRRAANQEVHVEIF